MKPNELISPPLSSNEKRFIFMLLLISLIPRLYVFFQTYVISIDGVHYIRLAKYFADGQFMKGVTAHPYPPLYPVLIAVFSKFTPNFEVAGQLVSMVFGIALFIPVYYFTRDHFGPRLAQITAILFAFHHQLVKYSSQVRTESPYYFLAAMGLYFGWKAMGKKKAVWFIPASIAATLSYLTRPDGVGVIVILLGWLLISRISTWKKEWLFKFTGVFLLLLPAVMIALPYMFAIKEYSFGYGKDAKGPGVGETKISRKHSVLDILGLNDYFVQKEVAEESDETGELEIEKEIVFDSNAFLNFFLQFLDRFWRLLVNFIDVFNPVLFLLALFGIFRRRVLFYMPRFEWFIFSFFIFYLCLFAMIRVSHRHPTQLIALTLFWTAIGVQELHYVLLVKFSKGKSAGLERLSMKITHVILALLIITCALPSVKPRRIRRLPVKQAGYWLKENGKPDPRIVGNAFRTAFYADSHISHDLFYYVEDKGRFFHRENDLLKLVKNREIDYIALNKHTLSKYSYEKISSMPEIEEVVRYQLPKPLKGHETVVFQVKD